MSIAEVKVGDRIKIESSRYVRGAEPRVITRIVTASRITPTELHAGVFKFYRQQPKRVNGNMVGREIGGGHFHYCAIATPAECAEYDKRQADDRQAASDRQKAQERHSLLMSELRDLYEEQHVCVQNDEEGRTGEYQVTFHRLSESEVKDLARKLK